MRGGGASAAARGRLGPALVPWVAPALLDVYLALGGFPRPRAWQIALEILLLAGLGRSQWRLARGWLRSPIVPAGVLAVFALAIRAPTTLQQLAFYLAGVLVAVGWTVRAIGRRWRVPLAAGTAAALAVVLLARAADVLEHARPEWGARPPLAGDLLWPLRGLGAGGAPAADGPPIVLVSIDTLRWDAAEQMASVQRLAALGARWRRAMSTSSWTLPALASLQTGRMPAAHGAACLTDGHCQGLAAGVPTLAEALRAAGWRTAAVVANPWATTGTGFHRGFETFVEPGRTVNRLVVGGPPRGPHPQDDARVVDVALAWLGRAPARGFYLWVHLIGPHMPYLHADDESMRALDPAKLRSSYPVSPERRAAMRAAYDGEVAYTDRQVTRLLDALDARGGLANMVVILTADHGEEFWEHGGVEHGHSHHAEVVDVPLVLVAPGVAPGDRPGVASLVDVAPTVRAIAGLAPEGIDLRAGVPADRIATAWGGLILHLDCSARGGARRVIARDCVRDPARMRAYDLARDPAELIPAPAPPDDPVTAAARAIQPPARGDAAHLPADRLRALGYVR